MSDERWMAYVDGELDAEQRAAFEAALAADPQLAQRVREQQALRRRLVDAYASDLDEPVPERLLAAARGRPEAGEVVDLARAREQRSAAQRTTRTVRDWRWPEWGAIAASVLIGVVAGRVVDGGDEAPFASTRSGALVARGPLDSALSAQLASSVPADAPVHVGISFVARSGPYCRSFVMARPSQLAGLACRDGGQWQVQLVTPAGHDEAAGGYRAAGAALPPALLRAIDERIAGTPLDASAEADAARRGWQH
jgi:anti-sigma factor RsiW